MRLGRPCLRLLALPLVVAMAPLCTSPALAASPRLNLRQTLSGATRPSAPGLAAAAPTAAALAQSVRQDSGLDPSQVAIQSACPRPRASRPSCGVQTLVLRSTHRPVHPHVTPVATFTQLFPRRRPLSPATVAPLGSMSSTSAAPPTAGTPAYLQQAYDLTYLSQTAGGSDTVAIVDAGDDPNAALDLATYRSTYGLPACTSSNGCFRKVNENGATSPLPPSATSAWEEEISLDLDAVSALCPNCHILLVETNATGSALDTGISSAISLGANQVSNSWTAVSSTPVGVGSFPGAAIIAGTGDNGYPGAGNDDYPAAFPGVTAAGATTLSSAPDSSELRGYSESAWTLNSSGPGQGGAAGCNLNEPKPSYQSDTGCTGRSYSDISADGNPDTGLRVYDSGDGGWFIEGGTSLATPLVAAFEAITGVNGTNAQWAYTGSALLNDPTTGSIGTCAQTILYICNAGIGYDGPTGIGSISGAIAPGAPGIGGPGVGGGSNNTYAQSVATTSASLTGGVYPNGLDTTYYWQYGTTTSYGLQTPAADVGAGQVPVVAPASLSGLTPGTTYHYRLVAHNSDGTDYGYDYTLATNPVTNIAPVNTAAPSISGSVLQGQMLTASPGAWSPNPTSYAYQWQRSSDGGTTWTDISGATNSTYAIPTGDLGDELGVTVTATDVYGSNTADSSPTGPVGSGAPALSSGPNVLGHADQGQVLSVVSTWNPAGAAYTYQWQNSADGGSTWTNIAGATSSAYTLTPSDLGDEVRVTMTAVNVYGNASATSAGAGPVAANAPVNTGMPTVSGTAQRTHTLTATAGSWTGVGDIITYQWQRSPDGTNWTGIGGATGVTYNLAQADEGDVVRVLVTATNTYGVTSQGSSPTQLIASYPPANTAVPTISGVAQRGATLNTTPGTWTGPDNIYTYQWQRDAGEGYVNIGQATGTNYALTVADEGAKVRVVVTATDPDATISEASAASATVTDAVPVNQSAPTISGTAARGLTLTASVGNWSGIGNSYAYEWQRSTDGSTWTDIAGATSSTYSVSVADETDVVRVMISVANPDGTAGAASAATATVATAPPATTVTPTISGTAQRGVPLAGSRGTWNGNGNNYTYQWQRSVDGVTWTSIAGATGLSYTPAVADEGDYLRLGVTATNVDATVLANTQPTVLVAATPPVNTAAPGAVGTPARGQNLTANVGTWSGVSNSYTCQWQRSSDGGTTWTNIAGATAWTYTVAVADEGAQLRALVTATNADTAVSAVSAASLAVTGEPPVNATTPTISGSPLRGSTLTSTQGAWAGLGNAYSYQWQRSADGATTWTNISGAITSSYTLAVADEGDQVRLLVTAINPDATVSAASPATGVVSSAAPANTAPPAVSGSAQRGLTLTSAQGTWNGVGNAYAYQWQRSGDSGTTWANITGATSPSYTLTVADEGDTIRFAVTGTNSDGTATGTSAATATVTATPPGSTTAPTITGTAARGSTLTSYAGTWLGVGNGYAYQWQSSSDNGTTWTNIGGATTTAYSIGVADEATEIRLMLTATNVDGSSSAASAPTAVVPAAPPVNTVAPTVSGTAKRGFLLTATPGSWSGIGNTLAYQWQRSTDGTTWADIPGATLNTYALGLGDEGSYVRVKITAANPDGTSTVPSPASGIVATAPPVNSAAPTIRGTPRRGSSLTSTPGVWSGTGNALAYQWQRSSDATTWTNITGATNVTYTVGVADEGGTVRLLVTDANPDGTTSAVSPATGTILTAPPVNTVAPTISGTAQRAVSVTSTSGSWNGVGDVLGYQWQRSADSGVTWTNISGATSTAYTLGVADEGDVVRLLVTATNPDGTAAQGSAPTAPVQTAPPVNTVAPAIIGTTSVGATLAAGTGAWSPGATSYTYQWQEGTAGGGYQAISGATTATYTTVSGDVGDNIRVIVTATNVDGSVGATSAPTPAVAAPPVDLVAPGAPSGTLQNGSLLTPGNGTWDSPATFAYAWERCPAAVTSISSGCTTVGTGSTYVISAADIGSELGVIVTATSTGGSTAADGALTALVTGRPLASTAAPSISGSPQIPNTLYANPGSWSVPVTAVTYQWDRCAADGVSNCTLVAADTSHYALSAADDGSTIVLIADVTSPGRAASAQSPPLTIQDQPLPQATILPAVSGTPRRTAVLAATGGSWTNNPTSLSYQWERCNSSGQGCQVIAGATRTTYQLGGADEGETITVAVSAANAAGANTATATPTGVVAGLLPTATRAPALNTLGVQQGVQVTVGGAAWQTTADTTYVTSWQRCNASGAACVTITGATQPAYMPSAADVGHTLVAVITATNSDGSVMAPTAASDVVLPAAPRWHDLPVLSATDGNVGGVLTITPGVWTGPVVSTDTDEIMRCTNVCTSISTASSYTIVTADIGAILRVRETASNAGGTTAVWSSQYAGPVGSTGSASVVLLTGERVLRSSNGTELGVAQVGTTTSVTADALVAGSRRHGPVTVRRVTVRRAAKIRGTLRVWVCPANTGRGAPPACTRQITVTGPTARLKLPAAMTGKVRVIVVHRGR